MTHQDRGIVYVAFGQEYDTTAAYTACYSRRFTELPFYVITDVAARCDKWQDVSNVEFRLVEKGESNRAVRTSLIDYTPFGETLMMDTDAVIQRAGIEALFSRLDGFEVGLVEMRKFPGCRKRFYRKFYKPVIDRLSLDPKVILSGAFVLFRKTDFAKSFFHRWNRLWVELGRTRDMPALMGVYETLRSEERDKTFVFTRGENSPRVLNFDETGHCYDDPEALICHRFEDQQHTWYNRFEVPRYLMNRPGRSWLKNLYKGIRFRLSKLLGGGE